MEIENERFSVALLTLGSLRNHDGYGDKNVISKHKFELF